MHSKHNLQIVAFKTHLFKIFKINFLHKQLLHFDYKPKKQNMFQLQQESKSSIDN